MYVGLLICSHEWLPMSTLKEIRKDHGGGLDVLIELMVIRIADVYVDCFSTLGRGRLHIKYDFGIREVN